MLLEVKEKSWDSRMYDINHRKLLQQFIEISLKWVILKLLIAL